MPRLTGFGSLLARRSVRSSVAARLRRRSSLSSAGARREARPSLVARRGLRSSLGALIAANLTYFGAYNALKGPGQPRGLNALLVPALAGVINVVVTCPVWVISTRLRTAIALESLRGWRRAPWAW